MPYTARSYFWMKKWINLPHIDFKKKQKKINMWNYCKRLSCEKAKQRCLQLTWERTAQLNKSILLSISDHKYLVRLFSNRFLFPRTHSHAAHTLTGNIEKVLFDALLKLSSQLRLNSAVKNQFPRDPKRKNSASQVAKYRMKKKYIKV